MHACRLLIVKMAAARYLYGSLAFVLMFLCQGVQPYENARPRSITEEELVGQWRAANYSRQTKQQFVFNIFTDSTEKLAITSAGWPVTWTSGIVSIDKGAVINLQVDTGESIFGNISTDPMQITWEKGYSGWLKVPQVQSVHTIFMNHLDVGYNGIPTIGYINNVLNTYFQKYFPEAVQLPYSLMAEHPEDSFIYTTHPWLVSLYVNCPPNLILNGVKLHCPTSSEVDQFVAALKKGYITWHAGAMNLQYELLDEWSLEASFKIAEMLSRDLGIPFSCSISLRDVPGFPVAAVDSIYDYFKDLCKRPFFISVGVNPGSSPPVTPGQLFGWSFAFPKSGVLATWHAGGYPLNPGFDISLPGGLSYNDTVIDKHDKITLAFAFRTDNSGPPTSTSEIHDNLETLRSQFVGANVVASTLDTFANQAYKYNIQNVSTMDVGDTWIQGVASDPRKMAEFRALRRAYRDCILADDCNEKDARFLNATRFMIKLPEHTWGLPSVGDTIHWSNAAFEKVKNEPNFQQCINSWIEQRIFTNLTLEALGNHPMGQYATKYLSELAVPSWSLLDNYVPFDPTVETTICPTCPNPLTVSFDHSTGGISTLYDKEIVWADKNHLLSLVGYHTFDEKDFEQFALAYDFYGNAGYDKPNSSANAHLVSRTWYPSNVTFLQSKTNKLNFLAVLEFDSFTHTEYGSPKAIWLNYTFSPNLTQSFDIDIVWFNKTATRLGEATMFEFNPLQGKDQQCFTHQFGSLVPIFNSMTNGSVYQRGGDGFTCNFTTKCKASLSVESLDVPVVCPVVAKEGATPFPYPSEAGAKPDLTGMAFNLHNNIWNTNYPLWYPFASGDENFKARFMVKLESNC